MMDGQMAGDPSLDKKKRTQAPDDTAWLIPILQMVVGLERSIDETNNV